jgi:hypothetical protein
MLLSCREAGLYASTCTVHTISVRLGLLVVLCPCAARMQGNAT